MGLESNQPFDLPDPVIAAYLARVQALTDPAFSALNGRRTPPLAWLNPRFYYYSAWTWLFAWTLRRASMAGCRDEDVLRDYRLFWAVLAHRGCDVTPAS
jgi:hypothetical protein